MKLKEDSKKEWTSNGTIEHINAGSLQRIADAVEDMSRSYREILSERDNYRRQYTYACDNNKKLRKQVAGLRGEITKRGKQC